MRARELAAQHTPGNELSADSRALLIQLRTAIRARKPCEFTTISELEKLFKLSQGYVARLATKQSHSGAITTMKRGGSTRHPLGEW